MEGFIELWKHIRTSFEESIHKNGDPRVKDWFLVYSPWPVLTLCVLYLIMCYLGPKLMEGRKAFQLNSVMLVYNILLVLLSAYMTIEFYISSRQLGFNSICIPVVYGNTPAHMKLASAIWIFYLSKLLEFLDTVFFILRKKNNQITFLHVYHHCSIYFLLWIAIKWHAGGSSFIYPMMNSAVHVIMYSYYGLSAFPSLRKYLWWKRYLTIMQLVEFLIMLIMCLYNIVTGCEYDKRVTWSGLFYVNTQFFLFLNFYRKTYMRKEKKTDSSSGMKNGDLDLSQAKEAPLYNGSVPSNSDIRIRPKAISEN